MTMPEMIERYRLIQDGIKHYNLQDEHSASLNTYGAWSNREEEWYFTNKRLLLSAKEGEICD